MSRKVCVRSLIPFRATLPSSRQDVDEQDPPTPDAEKTPRGRSLRNEGSISSDDSNNSASAVFRFIPSFGEIPPFSKATVKVVFQPKMVQQKASTTNPHHSSPVACAGLSPPHLTPASPLT